MRNGKQLSSEGWHLFDDFSCQKSTPDKCLLWDFDLKDLALPAEQKQMLGKL